MSANPNFGTRIALDSDQFPATIAAGDTWQSGPIIAGFGALVAACTSSQAGNLTVQRYADVAGQIPVGEAITSALTAATPAWATVSDGMPYLSFEISISNSGSDPANLTNCTALTGPL